MRRGLNHAAAAFRDSVRRALLLSELPREFSASRRGLDGFGEASGLSIGCGQAVEIGGVAPQGLSHREFEQVDRLFCLTDGGIVGGREDPAEPPPRSVRAAFSPSAPLYARAAPASSPLRANASPRSAYAGQMSGAYSIARGYDWIAASRSPWRANTRPRWRRASACEGRMRSVCSRWVRAQPGVLGVW